jgi:heptosyltransferase-2
LKFGSPVPHENQVYDYLNIASQVEDLFTGGSRVNFLRPQYSLSADEEIRKKMSLELVTSGWDLRRKLVAINPGATNNPLKRWYPDRFARLAERFVESGNCTVLFVGGPSEEAITDEILSRMHQPAIKLTGRTSLAGSIAVLSLCDLVVSNDTGPAYVAAALERPTVTIFGPTNYWSISPTSPTSFIVRHAVACAPCRHKQCPTDHECMAGITVDQVYKKSIELLGI